MGSSQEAGPSLGVLQILPLEAAVSQLGPSQQSSGEQKVRGPEYGNHQTAEGAKMIRTILLQPCQTFYKI